MYRISFVRTIHRFGLFGYAREGARQHFRQGSSSCWFPATLPCFPRCRLVFCVCLRVCIDLATIDLRLNRHAFLSRHTHTHAYTHRCLLAAHPPHPYTWGAGCTHTTSTASAPFCDPSIFLVGVCCARVCRAAMFFLVSLLIAHTTRFVSFSQFLLVSLPSQHVRVHLSLAFLSAPPCFFNICRRCVCV